MGMEVTLLPLPLMQKRGTMVVLEIKTMEERGPKEGKGRCYTCNKFGHYARECPNRRESPRDDGNNNFRGNGNQRNNRFKGKRKAPSDRSGNGQPFKRSRNSKYDESNVVERKNEYILIYSLSTASPSDMLDNWLIDSGA